MRFLPLLFAGLLAACASAPPPSERPPPERIPASALQQDIDLLERALKELHPGILRYNTPAQLDAHFARLRAELGHDASLPEAYLAFSRLTAALRCGHTYPNPLNQSDAVQGRLFRATPRLPFHFRWIDGQMVVWRNFSGDPRLPPGTQVQAVEGVPAGRILAQLLPYVRADGHNDDKRVSLLEVAGRARFEAFDALYPLVYPVDSKLQLRVLPPGAAVAIDIEVAANTAEQREAQRAALSPGEVPWRLRDAGEGVWVLDMPTWAVYDDRWDWRGWLESTLARPELRDARAIVVDLRRNEGGSDVGSDLLAHFIDREVPMPGYLRKTRYRSVPPALRPYLHTWDPGFYDWGAQARPAQDGFYLLEREGISAEGTRIEPQPPRMRARLFVLVSAVNSSATFDFARAVQRAGAGTLVGQRTGGNLRGITGGAFFFLYLPNSKLEIDLPLIGQFPLRAEPDAGLRPDIEVPPSAQDLASGRDAELEAVRAELRIR